MTYIKQHIDYHLLCWSIDRQSIEDGKAFRLAWDNWLDEYCGDISNGSLVPLNRLDAKREKATALLNILNKYNVDTSLPIYYSW